MNISLNFYNIFLIPVHCNALQFKLFEKEKKNAADKNKVVQNVSSQKSMNGIGFSILIRNACFWGARVAILISGLLFCGRSASTLCDTMM